MPARKRSAAASRQNQRPHSSRQTPESTHISYETQTILVVLLLLLFYPVGIVLMWLWMKWPVWVKLLVMLPILCGLVALFAMISLFSLALRSRSVEENRMMRYQQWQQTVPVVSPTSEVTSTPTPTSIPGY